MLMLGGLLQGAKNSCGCVSKWLRRVLPQFVTSRVFNGRRLQKELQLARQGMGSTNKKDLSGMH